MMKIRVNNKEIETGASYLLQLSQQLELPQTGIAVAINNRMVPRAEWEHFVLKENDELIIIKAVCGG
jgi:sulfur carrier protein